MSKLRVESPILHSGLQYGIYQERAGDELGFMPDWFLHQYFKVVTPTFGGNKPVDKHISLVLTDYSHEEALALRVGRFLPLDEGGMTLAWSTDDECGAIECAWWSWPMEQWLLRHLDNSLLNKGETLDIWLSVYIHEL